MNSTSTLELSSEALALKKRHTLTCLEFAYWALLHVDVVSFQNQKVNLSATFRHIGQEIFKSLPVPSSKMTPTILTNRPVQAFRVIREIGKIKKRLLNTKI